MIFSHSRRGKSSPSSFLNVQATDLPAKSADRLLQVAAYALLSATGVQSTRAALPLPNFTGETMDHLDPSKGLQCMGEAVSFLPWKKPSSTQACLCCNFTTISYFASCDLRSVIPPWLQHLPRADTGSGIEIGNACQGIGMEDDVR